MKSLAELQAIRDKARAAVNIRENAEAETRVLVAALPPAPGPC